MNSRWFGATVLFGAAMLALDLCGVVHAAGALSLPFADSFEDGNISPWVVTGDVWGAKWFTGHYWQQYDHNVVVETGQIIESTGNSFGAGMWSAMTVGPFSTVGLLSLQVRFTLSGSGAPGQVYVKFTDTLGTTDTPSSQTPPASPTAFTRLMPAAFLGHDAVTVSIGFYTEGGQFVPPADATVDNVSIAPVPGAICGTVTGVGGAALPGACMGVTGGTSLVPEHTGPSGKYRYWTVYPGTWTVTPQKPGYVCTPPQRTVTVTGGADAIADFSAAPGQGDGVVNRYAVLMGIADYTGAANDLQFADEDALDLREALVASGWPATHVHTRTQNQVTRAVISAEIAWLARTADADDVVVFFFSGRGAQMGDAVPVDEPDGRDEVLCTYALGADSVRDDELSRWFSALRTRKYAVLLNLSYGAGQTRAPRQMFDLAPEATGAVRTRDLDDLSGGVVVAACSDGQTAAESVAWKNGVFPWLLTYGLTSCQADLDQNGAIAAEELYGYARAWMARLYPNQTPELYDAYPGDLDVVQLPTLIVASQPARDAVGVNRTADLRIAWRWYTDQASAESHFSLRDAAGQPVAGSCIWFTPGKGMIFKPSPWLAADSPYTVEVAPGLLLANGTTRHYGDRFTFRTAHGYPRTLHVSGVAQATPQGGAQISLSLSGAATVNAVVCNIAGRPIAVLGETVAPAGVSTMLWNGRSANGLATPAGQYLVRVQARDAAGNAAAFVVPLRK